MTARAFPTFALLLALCPALPLPAQDSAGALLRRELRREPPSPEAPAEDPPAEPGDEAAATPPVDPHPGNAAYKEAVAAWRGGDLATARAKLGEALEKEPGLAAAQKSLVLLDLAENRHGEALTGAEALLVGRPNDPSMLRTVAEAADALGDRAKAAATLDRLAELDRSPMATNLLYNDGARAWNADELELAQRRFEQVLARDPELGETLKTLARLHALKNEHEQALELAERGLDLDADDRELLEICYQAHQALGQLAEARMVLLEIEELE